jgi:hypothetical protein
MAKPPTKPKLPLRRTDPSVYRPNFWPAVRNSIGVATGMWPHLPSKMAQTPPPKSKRTK